MYCSAEEACDILNKWKTEHSLVHCLFVGSDFCVVHGLAWIHESSSRRVIIALGRHASLDLLSLDGATFAYSDPREAHPNIRTSTEARYERSLTITLPLMQTLYLSELKNIEEADRQE
jgi:hypothetical protein